MGRDVMAKVKRLLSSKQLNLCWFLLKIFPAFYKVVDPRYFA
jgi:hypothetical protein